MTDVKKLTFNMSETARVLGLAVTQVSKMSKDGTLTKDANGEFNLCKSVIAYIDLIKSKKTEQSANYEKARARKMESSADIEEMNAAKKRGELVEIDSVVDIVESEYSIVRQKLFAIPNKVALDVYSCETPQEVQELLLNQMNEALSELKFDIDGAADVVEGESPEASPENQLS